MHQRSKRSDHVALVHQWIPWFGHDDEVEQNPIWFAPSFFVSIRRFARIE